MDNSFNRIYGKPDDPFYYGLQPSEELEAFLVKTCPQGGEALDLGCGEGRDSLLLARYGFHVLAIDCSSSGLRKLERYTRLHGVHNLDCVVADVRSLQLQPDFYDAIIANTFLDHLNKEDGRKVAASIVSALKPGGFAYIKVFTTHDPGASEPTNGQVDAEVSETASFVKHYFEDGELAVWFAELDVLFYEEKMKYDEAHGNPHYHGLAVLIGIKRF